MFGTVTGNPTGYDLASFSCKISEKLGVFIVNPNATVGTKPTYLPSVICHSASVKCHCSPLSLILFPDSGPSRLFRGSDPPLRRPPFWLAPLSLTKPEGPHDQPT